MKKTILNEKTVCEMYTEQNLGVELIAKELHTGKERIRDILKKNNVEMKKRGGQTLCTHYVVEDFHTKKYVNDENFHYVAIDLKTGVESKDIDNTSGFLTSYIEKTYGVSTPTLYERRQYYMTTGNYWWEQWFNVEKRENRKIKKCPYCEWTTYDVNNRGGSFRLHLKKEHNMDVLDYLSEHPEDKDYMSFANPSLNVMFETDEKKYVVCGVCGKKFARISTQHVKSHGLTVTEYEEKYGTRLCENFSEYLRKQMVKRNTEMKPVFTSKPQIEIKNFIESKGVECQLNNRKVLKGKEIDIYIPSLKIGIEYNGNFWHTEGMNHKTRLTHLEKTEAAIDNGIKLIQIFEDEYVFKKEIVFSKIEHLLHVNKLLTKIPARKCEIKQIDVNEADLFLEQYHIQGFASSTIYLGAFYNNKLIAVMSFLKDNNSGDKWTLTRFASDTHFICQGVGGKLFKFFIRKYTPSYIKSFADRRWTIDEERNIYKQLGFVFDGYTEPNYTYYNQKVDRYRRFHKFGFRKRILHRKYGLPLSMTENEMTKELGYKKIWDCGLIRYIYRNHNYVNAENNEK